MTGHSSVFGMVQRLREGLVPVASFQRRVNTLHMQSLELSGNRDLESFHDSSVNDLDIDISEQRYLVSGSCEGSLAVHDLESWKSQDGLRVASLVCTISAGNRDAHKRSVETVQWYPLDTGIFTSSGADRTLKIWDANRLQTAEEYSFNGIVHSHHMSAIATRHSLIAIGTDSSNVKLVDPRAGSSTHVLRGHKEGGVRAVRWSNRDEFVLATGGVDNFAMMWDVRAAKGCLMKFHRLDGKKHSAFTRDTTHDGSVNGLGFTSDGLHLMTVGTDQKLTLWHTGSGKKISTRFPPLSHVKKRHLKFCATGCGQESTVFVPTGTCVSQFALTRGAKARKLYGHYNNVNCCVYHEPRHLLLTGGNDRKILVWAAKGDKEYEQFLLHRADKVVPRVEAGVYGEGVEVVGAVQEPHTLDTWSDEEEDGT